MTSWSLYRLPPQQLEAVLARELAHRLATARRPSLLLYWLTVPAGMMGRAIVFCLKYRVLSILAKIVIGFLLIGGLGGRSRSSTLGAYVLAAALPWARWL